MPLMPAFHRRKKDSAVVGRLIAGHGELEFLLAMCTGVALAARRKPDPKHTRPRHRIRYEHIGIKRFFRIRGEQYRIDYAKKQMHKVFFKMGMRADYIEIMGAMATCLKIRNLFAHCHWGQSKKRGLFFIDLEAAGVRQEGSHSIISATPTVRRLLKSKTIFGTRSSVSAIWRRSSLSGPI
jgi:hypothetical protein